MAESNKYLLSIVICGRNDNYLGDFKYKITTTLNYLCSNIVKLQKQNDIEVILVDWNSDVPLSQDIELIQCAHEVVKFVIVPPDIAAQYNSHHSEFNSNCALNSGIKRAGGEYIMVMCGDTLMPTVSLQNLILLLEQKIGAVFETRKTLINIGRKYIPWQKVKTKPNLAEWERYLQLHSRHLVYDNGFCGLSGSYGAILLHKDIWQQSQGFFENYAGWGGGDVEQSVRICIQYPYIDPIYFGIVVYDMTENSAMRAIKETSFHYDFIPFPKQINMENQFWGLQNHHLQIVSERERHINKFGEEDEGHKESKEIFTLLQLVQEILKVKKTQIICRLLKATHMRFPKKEDWPCLFLLVWYCSKYNPSKYIEIGKSDGHSFIILTRLIHSIELYGLNTFDNLRQGELLSHNLSRNGYRGYIRFVMGDHHTALGRLEKSFIGNMSFGAVLFRIDMFKEGVTQYISKLFEHVEYNGLVIITGHDSELFATVWEFIQTTFPMYIQFGFKKINIGFVIKSANMEEYASLEQNNNESLLTAWKYPLFLKVCYELQFVARKIFNKFYEKYWTLNKI